MDAFLLSDESRFVNGAALAIDGASTAGWCVQRRGLPPPRSRRISKTDSVDGGLRLRPVEESQLAPLLRLWWDPEVIGEFQWFGFRRDRARELERRWKEDGLIGEDSSFLAVMLDDGTCAGDVGWRRSGPFGNVEIGIALFPEHRGHGIGTEAQRQLVDYLFDTTTAHRIQAGTEVDNVAEQRALERVGFTREGVHRQIHFRSGQWRDGIIYGLLRGEQGPAVSGRSTSHGGAHRPESDG
jgi:RimJ/RimL family protein N-acetyltransferase